ncbi:MULTISPECIES: hypothetical protein [unclassified Bradyrhizobium]|uniref:hypothetical protein n=1 Tax=unclassified Bradyrhizobium TaxID=2631580 RepID=UPI002478DF82|nr:MULTISPECIES: hypothetical protein [unclassified Bradyrhizobium]WGS22841.1 hypothetical protein MTX22_14965 [Bradyrhizobium sp. ISRA463]WGS29832.1 hypothetical protein MTX19_12710 [Bradyrhizobium sp. ISRA464]
MVLKKSPSDLLGNPAWNAIAFAVAVLLNLAILPFVISRLGPAAFGVAGLVRPASHRANIQQCP